MTKATSDLLKKAGVPNHLKGYEYLGEAIEQVAEDRERIHLITKFLYPSIAKKFNTTVKRMDRAIRFAIEYAFDNAPPEILFELFGNTLSYNKGKPGNSQFIATLSDLITQEN